MRCALHLYIFEAHVPQSVQKGYLVSNGFALLGIALVCLIAVSAHHEGMALAFGAVMFVGIIRFWLDLKKYRECQRHRHG